MKCAQRRKPGISGQHGLTGEASVRARPLLHLFSDSSISKDHETQAAGAGACASLAIHQTRVPLFSLIRSGWFFTEYLEKSRRKLGKGGKRHQSPSATGTGNHERALWREEDSIFSSSPNEQANHLLGIFFLPQVTTL